ncbi:lymphocyte antigen 6H-like [Dromiciops gliroides]|uniref:lymphocyte antigen 6H-like n=1 Tax=Dromiciops gliroides TaxID=33562 RepID=UPI001CC46FED|nr:lymphocyte antigen 6H-like [Dromiciops gliroides]
MKVLFPVLLSILLCVEPVHSIKCYNCTNQSSQCSPVQCSTTATHCGSLEASNKNGPQDKKIYFKGCVENCENFFRESLEKARISPPLIKVDYSCCVKELCNGADGIRGSPFALMGALLLSLGPASIWAML